MHTPQRATLVITTLLAAGLALAGAWLFRAFTIDDSHITFRYVSQWVAGNGLVYNIGERVEGFSNFLWVVLLAPWKAAGVDLLSAARVMGAAFTLATIGLVAGYARGWRLPGASALLLGSLTPVAVWTVAGLETPLVMFLLTAAVLSFAREEERGDGALSGVLFGLLGMARPETVAYAGVAFLVRAWRLWRERRAPERRDLIRLGAFLGVLVPYHAWRLSYYGHPLPNTVYAKSTGFYLRGFVEGFYYLFEGVSNMGGVGLFALSVVPAALRPAGARARLISGLGLALLAAFAGVTVLGAGDWMPESRFFVHVAPLAALVAHAGLASLAGWGDGRAWRAGTGLALAACVAFAVAQSVDARFVQSLGAPAAPEDPETSAMTYLQRRVRPGDVVAVVDAGGIAYNLPLDVRVLDMVGLTDAHIARVPPRFPRGIFGRGDGFGKWDVDYVLSQAPRFVEVHVLGRAPDGRWLTDSTAQDELLNDPRFQAQYRRVEGVVGFGLFERR